MADKEFFQWQIAILAVKLFQIERFDGLYQAVQMRLKIFGGFAGYLLQLALW